MEKISERRIWEVCFYSLFSGMRLVSLKNLEMSVMPIILGHPDFYNQFLLGRQGCVLDKDLI